MNEDARKDICLILQIFYKYKFKWLNKQLVAEVVADQELIKILNSLDQSETVAVEVRINGILNALSDLNVGVSASVRISPPRGSTAALVEDELDLISISNICDLPKNFAITSTKYLSWEALDQTKQPTVVVASGFLNKAIELELIEVVSGFVIISNHNTKIKAALLADINAVSARKGDVDRASILLNTLFEDTIHKPEKRRIVQNAFVSALKGSEEDQRLTHFLKHAEEIIKNAHNNYELFISKFSFDNDKDKLNEQKRDFSVKLNSLLIGIQGKLLAIPISTILAITQFKDESTADYVLINISVMFSSFLFLLIIYWLIRSQIETIQSIRQEIVEKERRFSIELPKLFREVEIVFKVLKSSCVLNIRMARVLTFLAIGMTIVTWYVFLLKTPEVFSIFV